MRWRSTAKLIESELSEISMVSTNGISNDTSSVSFKGSLMHSFVL